MCVSPHTWHEKVAEVVTSSGIVDAHEHLLARQQRKETDPDLFDWIKSSCYCASLLAAGMPEKEFCPRSPGDGPRRWRVLKPYLECTRTTSYALVIELATRDLFDFSFFNSMRTIGKSSHRGSRQRIRVTTGSK